MKSFSKFIKEAKVPNLIDEIKDVALVPDSDEQIPVLTKKDKSLKPNPKNVKEDYADFKILYSSKISDLLDEIKELAQTAIDDDINAEDDEPRPFVDWKGVFRTLEDIRDSFTVAINVSDDEADDDSMDESEFPSFRKFLSLTEESKQLDEISNERMNQYAGKALASRYKAGKDLKKSTDDAFSHELEKNKLIKQKADYSGPANKENEARSNVTKALKTLIKRNNGLSTAGKKLSEAFKPGVYNCKDNSKVSLSKADSDLLNKSMSNLSDSQKSEMTSSKQNLADAIALAKEMK